MAKITLNDLTTNYGSQSLHNTNNATIEDHLNNKVLYRDNPSGEANQMENEIDMNSNKIINLAAGTANADAVNYAQLIGQVNGIGSGTIARTIERQTGSAAVSRVFTFASLTYTIGNNSLRVVRNGQELDVGEDYTETSTSSITLTFDPNDNDKFKFIVFTTI